MSSLVLLYPLSAYSSFLVPPYLQFPTTTEVSILWFSSHESAGEITFWEAGGKGTPVTIRSKSRVSRDHQYTEWETKKFFNGKVTSAPYRHRVRLQDLRAGTEYLYRVVQGSAVFESSFRTAPGAGDSIRFAVFADCETEPESTGNRVDWADPAQTMDQRKYPIDQTVGFSNNLHLIRLWKPDFIAIAGDIVQSGGEQRDWDEFWKHLTHLNGAQSVAGTIPVLPAPGNHEYYAGPQQGQYKQPYSEQAIRKYLHYFEVPDNGTSLHRGRYYRFDYGPVTLLSIDSTNGTPAKSKDDTNFYLLGQGEPGGGHSPGFGPGTEQYQWLERELSVAQGNARFTFVMFHHAPYTTYHTEEPGEGKGKDEQSGVPMRALTPLFTKFGVDAVFAGHGEMLTRAEVRGEEIRPDGSGRRHVVHFYDVGFAGDELRKPTILNELVKFSAHVDSKEKWKGAQLLEGGKHYGHLEVEVQRNGDGKWELVMTPAYAFPMLSEDGSYQGFEKRIYRDVVRIVEP